MKRILMLLGFGLLAVPMASAQSLDLSLSKRFGSARLSVGYHSSRASRPTFRVGYHEPRFTRDSRFRTPARTWVGGHWETRAERVWIPGRSERVWRQPVHRYQRDACGRLVRVLVSVGGWQTVEHPGHWETRERRVWAPGCWRTVQPF